MAETNPTPTEPKLANLSLNDDSSKSAISEKKPDSTLPTAQTDGAADSSLEMAQKDGSSTWLNGSAGELNIVLVLTRRVTCAC
jgi:hypothetical protein